MLSYLHIAQPGTWHTPIIKTMKKYKISFEGEVLELWKYWLIFRVPKRRKKSRIENKTNTWKIPDAKMYSEVFKPQSAKSILTSWTGSIRLQNPGKNTCP